MSIDPTQYKSKSSYELLVILAKQEEYLPDSIQAVRYELIGRGFPADRETEIQKVIDDELRKVHENLEISFTRDQVIEAASLLNKRLGHVEAIKILNSRSDRAGNAEPTSSLPKVWLGFIFALAFLIVGFAGVGSEYDFGLFIPILLWLVQLGGWTYWLWCIHRFHIILDEITRLGYPISPWSAVGKHFIPFYNLYWIFKWPMEFSRFINQQGRTRIMSGMGLGLLYFVSILLFRLDGALGFCGLFLVGIYLQRKLAQHLRMAKMAVPQPIVGAQEKPSHQREDEIAPPIDSSNCGTTNKIGFPDNLVALNQEESSAVPDLPAKKCPKCGASALNKDSFCSDCGTSLQEPKTQACEKCGAVPKNEDRFCRDCGIPLRHMKT